MTNLHFIAEKAEHRYGKSQRAIENEITVFSSEVAGPKSLFK